MKIKKINLVITMFVLIGLIIFVGADGNLSNSYNDSGVSSGESQESMLYETEYILLEDITGYEKEITNEENQNILLLEKETNQTEQESSAGQETIFEENSNIKEGISKQNKTEANETGQKEMTNLNETEIPINHTDVRGNTQDVDTSHVSTSNLNQDNTQDVGSTSESTSSPIQTNTQEAGADSSPMSVSSPNQDQEYLSINLDDVINNTQDVGSTSESTSSPNQDQEIEISSERIKEIYYIYSEGQKAIEISAYNEKEIPEIKREEIKKSEFEKQIIISSQEHLEESIRVYTSLNQEAKINEISIFWENEDNLEITSNENFSVKYYDEDNNGFVDKISWIVPHLSEQRFNVLIEIEKETESQDQILLNVEAPDQQTTNPINFNIQVNYSWAINCTLRINESEYNLSYNSNYSLELPNGSYNWFINCYNVSNSSVYNSTFGSFTVNESFAISEPDKIYLLDQQNNLIGEIDTLTISSYSNSLINVLVNRPDNSNYTSSFTGTNFPLILNKTIITNKGIYKLNVSFREPSANKVIEENFSVAKIDFIFDNSTIEEGGEKTLRVIVNSDVENLTSLIVDYGQGEDNNVTFYQISNKNFDKTFKNVYERTGTYEIFVKLVIGGKYFEVKVGTFVVKNSKDNSAPNIELEYPKHNAVIYDDTIIFRYSARDNVKIQNCTFRLYDISGTTEDEIESVRKTTTLINNNEDIEISLKDFEEKEYEWYVECFDNSSNKEYDFNLFEVDLSNTSSSSSKNATFLSSSQNISYENKEEIEETTSKINEFLINEEDLGVKEKEALEALGISENMQYYKKRLIQIGQYFVENYKYVSSEELREQKNEEYLIELENIRNSIPLEIEVLDSYEYVKNSIEVDLEELVSDYLESTDTVASKSLIRDLAKANLELQQKIAVSADIKQVEIKYENGTKEIILVTKTIEINDKDYNQILEIIPKEIAEDSDEVVFLVDKQVIKKDPIFEILSGDLNENNQIVYYIEKNLDIKKISKTETVLFEDSIKVNSKVTGLFVLNILPNADPVYFAIAFILIIFLIILTIFILRIIKIRRWKKEPNVVKMFDLLNQSFRFIKEKELERAKEGYHEMQRVYPVLPDRTKSYFYKKIEELLFEIDKRDIFGLVREYEEAKRHWKKEDCVRIYNDIKKVYERLPEKYRKKVYERISKY